MLRKIQHSLFCPGVAFVIAVEKHRDRYIQFIGPTRDFFHLSRRDPVAAYSQGRRLQCIKPHDIVGAFNDQQMPQSADGRNRFGFLQPMLPKQLLAAMKALHEMNFFRLALRSFTRFPEREFRFVHRVATEERKDLASFVVNRIADSSAHASAGLVAAGVTWQVTHFPFCAQFRRQIRAAAKVTGGGRTHRQRIGHEFFVQIDNRSGTFVRTFRQRRIEFHRFSGGWRRYGCSGSCGGGEGSAPGNIFQVCKDGFESIAAWSSVHVIARLHEVDQADEVPAPLMLAFVTVATPLLGVGVHADCERAIAGRFGLRAVQKTSRADFIADVMDYVGSNSVETHDGLHAHAPDKFIHVDKLARGSIHGLPKRRGECYARPRLMTNVFTTSRDIELLTSLTMGPFTTAQLLKLSETFAAGSFRSSRTLLDRLQRLIAGGFIRRFPLAIIHHRGGGLPYYYKLTPSGLRLLYGEEARPSSKQFFSPVAVARHYHTHSLCEFLVTTAVAAQRRGFRMSETYPENTLILNVNGEVLIPDTRFDLVRDDQTYRFLIEQDCSTETIRSAKHDETIHRKLRLHDAYQDEVEQRHRVVFVASRSRERLKNILNAAANVVRNPHRTLFLGVYLRDYVNANDPLGEKLFLDHRGKRQALLSNIPNEIGSPEPQNLTLFA